MNFRPLSYKVVAQPRRQLPNPAHAPKYPVDLTNVFLAAASLHLNTFEKLAEPVQLGGKTQSQLSYLSEMIVADPNPSRRAHMQGVLHDLRVRALDEVKRLPVPTEESQFNAWAMSQYAVHFDRANHADPSLFVREYHSGAKPSELRHDKAYEDSVTKMMTDLKRAISSADGPDKAQLQKRLTFFEQMIYGKNFLDPSLLGEGRKWNPYLNCKYGYLVVADGIESATYDGIKKDAGTAAASYPAFNRNMTVDTFVAQYNARLASLDSTFVDLTHEVKEVSILVHTPAALVALSGISLALTQNKGVTPAPDFVVTLSDGSKKSFGDLCNIMADGCQEHKVMLRVPVGQAVEGRHQQLGEILQPTSDIHSFVFKNGQIMMVAASRPLATGIPTALKAAMVTSGGMELGSVALEILEEILGGKVRVIPTVEQLAGVRDDLKAVLSKSLASKPELLAEVIKLLDDHGAYAAVVAASRNKLPLSDFDAAEKRVMQLDGYSAEDLSSATHLCAYKTKANEYEKTFLPILEIAQAFKDFRKADGPRQALMAELELIFVGPKLNPKDSGNKGAREAAFKAMYKIDCVVPNDESRTSQLSQTVGAQYTMNEEVDVPKEAFEKLLAAFRTCWTAIYSGAESAQPFPVVIGGVNLSDLDRREGLVRINPNQLLGDLEPIMLGLDDAQKPRLIPVDHFIAGSTWGSHPHSTAMVLARRLMFGPELQGATNEAVLDAALACRKAGFNVPDEVVLAHFEQVSTGYRTSSFA